jgi:hypothetical protein
MATLGVDFVINFFNILEIQKCLHKEKDDKIANSILYLHI